MTKTKKVVSMLLAFLMIFSSASVLASAWDVDADDGKTLEISTKIFKEVNGEWVETTKVAPGSNVKARVYIGTDYYSNDSDLLFFYDKDFFTHNFGAGLNALTVNPDATIDASGYFVADSDLTDYVDSAFLDEYAGIAVTLDVNTTNNVMFDDSTWLLEFDLVVLDTATGEGDFFVEETTIQNTTTQSEQKISVPKGPADGTLADAYPMWLWDATPVLASQPVSTLSSVTFNANDGEFADGETEVVVGTNIGEDVAAPSDPSRAGYTFMGWIDAADATPTLEEAKATVVVANVPEEPITYNAFWLKNVNITFVTDGGTEIAPIEDVTPYTDFADVADPVKEGYTFLGWSPEIPETYPDADATYTAIWALNVTVSFDTDGAEAIPSVNGYAGQDFDVEVPNPSKEGHRFVMWSPALPDVYPEADTTYKAIFETKSYSVYYYVDGKMKLNIALEYGENVPTNVASVKVPAGYELDGWYTDADCTVAYTGGTIGAETLKLYAKTTPIEYNAIFVADGEVYATIPTAYDADIVAPSVAPTKAGYEFAGWTPNADGTFTETEDMYFYATWNPINGNVIFYVDNAEYQIDAGILTGEEIDVPADPYKDGYTFLGWADAEGATEANVTFPQTMPALADGEKVMYYAVFAINSYEMTWDVDGVKTTDTYEYNATIVAPADPVKEGYTFTGWDWTRTEGGEAVAAATNMPAYNATATATWSVNEYTVTWDVDGVTTVETYAYGATIVKPADPVKEGFVFNGWDPAVASTMGAADVTYTATWANATDTPYTVETYTMAADGTYGEPATETKYGETGAEVTATYAVDTGFELDAANSELTKTIAADGSTVLKVYLARLTYKVTTNVDGVIAKVADVLYGAEIAEPTAPANKEGHTFAGWEGYTEGMTMPAADVEFTATWTVNDYTVTWDVDGALTEETYAYGEEIVKKAAPVKEGYTFAGWEGYADGMTMPAENKTFTATWTVNNYTVTWDVDGVTTEETYAYGATINEMAAPTKEGYTFAGWSGYTADMTMPAEDKTFTAAWTVNEYTVTWDVDGATTEETYAYGATIVKPADPAKAGYTFAGWTPEVPATQGVGDATYTATWVPAGNSYKVETYLMDTEGNYSDAPTSTEVLSADTESTVTAAHVEKTGFTPATEGNVLEGVVAADGSTTLKLYYVRNQYTFKTIVDGAETAETYYYEAAVAAPAAPEKAGYDFAGWDGSVPATMPAEDVTLTATWTASTNTQFTVIINYNDGANGDAPATDVNVLAGTTGYNVVIVEEIPDAPEADTVYVLWSDLTEDWADAEHYELSGDVAEATIAADGSTVINANFVPVTYTATFNAGEGTFADGTNVATSTVDHFDLVKDNLPAEPTREGWTFGGWKGVNDSLALSGDRTFTADWTVNAYTVTWDVDGATTEVSYDYGATIVLPEEPTKEGYTFAGWEGYTDGMTMPAANQTFTATWTVNNYTVTWDIDGATTVETYAYGAEIAKKAEPTKEGYTFAGWEGYTDGMTMPAANQTFTATWSKNSYTVTWIVDGVEETETYEYGAEIKEKAAPVKEGYTFAGWEGYTDGMTMPAANQTFTATWTVNNYTVTWNVDGAEETVTYAYGEEIAEKAAPVKEGYTFTGWEGYTAGMTMPATDKTFTATWSINSYNAIFVAENGWSETVSTVYGKAPVAPAAPAKEGYGFAGWQAADGTVYASSELPAIGAADVTYTAVYTAGAVNYTVETYLMDTEGNYGAAASTETKSGTADTTATAAHVAKEGFSPDEANTNSKLSGNIEADGSLVLKLYYSRNQYALSTEVDGVVTKVADYYYEAAVAEPAAPAKEGYTFTGWAGYTAGMTMPAKAVTLKATWTVNNYTVTWDNEGDLTKVTYAYGAEITLPEEPVKEGYTFNGWKGYTEGMTMPADNVTFTADWVINSYNVTWDVDGALTEETYEYGAAIVVPAEPTKEGYTFAGWDPSVPATMPAEDKTFTATWDVNNYTVTWDNEGAITEVTYAYGAEIVLPEEPVKEGNTFNGWVGYTDGMTMPAENVTFTADWTVNSYTITYMNLGSEYTAQTVLYGDAIVLPAEPTREGYTFTGWDPTVPATMPAENLKVNAGWSKNNYTVTWDVDGVTTVETYAYGAEIVEMEAPVKEGYTFTGWEGYTDGMTMPAANQTFKATWSINSYTVTWVVDGVEETVTYTYGAEIAEKAEPTKEGYTFTGWEGYTDGMTMPAENKTFTATWAINSYKVTWDVDGALTEETYEYGAAIVVPAEPVKEGFTFAGWTPAVPATQGAADATYTATWNVNSYSVTWIVDGEVIKTETLDYGAAVVAPAPEKAGYTFSGWEGYTTGMAMPADNVEFKGYFYANTDTLYTVKTYVMDTEGNYGEPSVATKTGKTDSDVVITPEEKTGFTVAGDSKLEGKVTADNGLVLKVYYARNEYKVFTNVDGVVNEVETVYYEAVVAEPAAPAKEGYTFAGWEGYTAGMAMPAADVTLTAKWTVNNYTVTWDVDGVTTEETYAYGATINEMEAPVKEGYTFTGWEGYTEGMTMPAADKTFTATWAINSYKVTWDVDGALTEETYEYGAAIVKPADPTKEGYTFTGWSPAVPATQGAADATYVAQFAINQYTVTYANTGDSTIAAVTADFGTAIADVEDPAWEGYTFRGWKWTDAEGNEISAPATIPAYNVTATAQWTANSYTIEWIVDGTVVSANAYDFGAAIVAPADPAKEGYTFAGWTWAKKADGTAVASSATMPAYNVTATAQWTAKGDTAYTVEIYKMATDGVTFEKVDTITGLTGATASTATYVIGAETGFTVNADKTTGYDAAANTANAVIAGDGSTVIAVYYDRDSYEITINGKTEDYYYGEEIVEPAKPEAPTGYEQDGWVDENGDTVTFPLTANEDAPSTIKPNYKKLSYQIAWTIEGVTTTETYEFEAAVTAPEIPAKEGFRIVGWVDATGKLVTVPATMPAANLAYTAVYETLVYGINYKVDGKLVSTVSAEYGDALKGINYTAPLGYEFDGWYTDEEMTTKLAADATVTAKETTLYGKTVAKLYNATFLVDGEEYAVVETAFDAQIIAPADPAKEGYTFIGWTPDVGIMDEEGKTFTANFEAAIDAFKVTYDVDGVKEVFNLTIGAEFEIPADPYKDGYTFAGWVDGDGKAAEFPATMPAEDLEFFATWTVNEYTVTWVVDDVTVATETYAYGAEIAEQAAPAKEGYTFAGWEGYTAGMTMPAEDLTFTATWATDTYTITWIVDGAETVVEYAYGAAIEVPADPAKEGFEFAGWDGEIPATMPAEDLTFTAQWTEVAPAIPVKLVPKAGTTTMIDRGGDVESYNDGYEVITDAYGYERDEKDSTFYDEWYIYGLAANMTKAKLANYFEVQGDGRIETDTTLTSGKYGTGVRIYVYDRNGTVDDETDDIFVEQFYVVIFGDVNGDGRITATDSGLIDDDLYLREWSANRGGIAYMKRAASLDGNTRVTATDSGLLDEVIGRYLTIDQVTGLAE